MRIALVTDGVPPYVIGGMQKHSLNLLQHLLNEGIGIDFYHCSQNSLSILEVYPELKHQENLYEWTMPFPKSDGFWGHYMRSSAKFSQLIFNEFNKREMPDLVYCKGFTALSFAQAKKKGTLNIPLIVNFHGYEMFQQSPDLKSSIQKKYLFQKPVLKILQQADAIMSYGGKITGVIENQGIENHKIVEIPGGIDKEWINDAVATANKPYRFVFIGRNERRKGIQELTQVLKSLENETFEFTFIGPIPGDSQLKIPQVKYLGEINDTKIIRNHLQNADFLVCPSFSEGMPNVILEAMASGCAIIATDVGAVSMCVNSDSGILIQPGKISELKNAMKSAISMDEQKVNIWKQNAVNSVKNNFLWSQIVNKHIMAFKKIIN